MAKPVDLIVGLGNPGAEYAQTRHNAGFWWVDRLADRARIELRHQAKFYGDVGRYSHHGRDCWLLKPMTFMNRSGQSVLALAQFYKIEPTAILVVHDELDLPPGTVRLKQGGGHGGHNGLRDIVAHLGTDFQRIRIGIGHPGAKDLVLGSVLGRPSPEDRAAIEAAIDDVIACLPLVLDGETAKAMNMLHRRQPPTPAQQ